MVDIRRLAKCISVQISTLIARSDVEDLQLRLEDPEQVATELEDEFRKSLHDEGIDLEALRALVRNEPFVLLTGVFSPVELPETPRDWVPVPTIGATVAAMLAIVLINRACGMETISYGSENAGALFVNLVALEGSGALVEKSKIGMKGHTDAASFPFRGTADPDNPRIAPSPDVVFLAAFRNPDRVPTVVMPLSCALEGLPAEHSTILKGPNLVLEAQRSFRQGTKLILGEEHLLDGTNILFDSPEGTWVRYSHSQSHVVNDGDKAVVAAKSNFEAACAKCAQEVLLEAGDLLVVNNRRALHGRSPVGEGIGGLSRWLLRSYGLDTTQLAADQRYASPRHQLYP